MLQGAMGHSGPACVECVMVKFGVVCAATLALAAPAVAQDLVPYDAVENWEILVDPTLGNGCLMMSEFEDGSTVRIGFDPSAGQAYVTAFNDAWGSIEEGKVYPIGFALDGETYTGEATGMYLEGVPGADVMFDNEDFLVDIAARQTMTLSNDGGEVMSIDLSHSADALLEVIACQEAQ
jgi:hypothetical protein